MQRRIKVKYSGRQWMTIGAAALCVWSGYELAVRLDTSWAWINGIREISIARNQSFLEDLFISFRAPAMIDLGRKLLFLLCCVVLGILCLIVRNRPRPDTVVIPLAVATAVAGCVLGVYQPSLSDWMQTLKLLPLLLIIIGAAVNVTQWVGDRRMDGEGEYGERRRSSRR